MLARPSLSPRVFFLFLSLSAGSRASRMASVFIIPSLVDGRTRDKQSRHCLYMPINGRHPPPPHTHTHLVLSSCFDLPPPRLCCCSGSLLSTNRSLHAHVLLDIVYSYTTHTLRKSEERERERQRAGLIMGHGHSFSLSFLHRIAGTGCSCSSYYFVA